MFEDGNNVASYPVEIAGQESGHWSSSKECPECPHMSSGVFQVVFNSCICHGQGSCRSTISERLVVGINNQIEPMEGSINLAGGSDLSGCIVQRSVRVFVCVSVRVFVCMSVFVLVCFRVWWPPVYSSLFSLSQ